MNDKKYRKLRKILIDQTPSTWSEEEARYRKIEKIHAELIATRQKQTKTQTKTDTWLHVQELWQDANQFANKNGIISSRTSWRHKSNWVEDPLLKAGTEWWVRMRARAEEREEPGGRSCGTHGLRHPQLYGGMST
jgi:hypothetical protein